MQPPSAELRHHLEAATAQYAADLAQDADAQQYLASRGFTPEAAIQARYGVVRHPLAGHESYAGRLALPYRTPSGVVNLRFRCLKKHDCKAEHCPKYLSLEGLETNLYGVTDLKKPSSFICIAEGEIDRDTLSLLCGLPAVGVAGVNAWADHFGRCLEDYEIKYSFADPDEAGSKLHKLLAKEVKARPIKLPKGKDCNDLYLERGAEGLRALIEA